MAIAAFVGGFGPVVRAYSPFVALGLAFVLSPILAVVTGGKYYIARENVHFHPESSSDTATCCICNCDYEPEDMAFCPVYDGAICSLCCSLDARCEDGCKPEFHSRRMEALLAPIRGAIAQKVSPRLGRRLLSFLGIFLFMALLVGALFGLVYYQTEFVSSDIIARDRLPVLFAKLYAALLVLVGIGAWWLVLTQESRQLAREELDKQNLQLQLEIRERQQAETALRQSEAQLKGQTQQLETALQELRDRENQLIQSEKMAALGGLVAGIAHEVNTPLGISITATSTLVERLKTFTKTYESGKLKRSELEKFIQTARQSTNAISGNLDRAAELIQSFKQVAVDRSTEERRAFNFKAYLEEILLQLRPKLKQTNHRVRICGADDLVLYSYPGAWSQIITNLVINSLVHAYEDGNSGDIELHFQTEGDRVVFCYRDDGCGIDKDNLNRIFEPFFTTKRGLGGSGLGLHVTYNLVTQKLDGTIECNSEPGVGTAFILTLPNPDRDELN